MFLYSDLNPINSIDSKGLYVFGINVGGSGTLGGVLGPFGPKGGLATSILLDHKGNIAVVTTQEIGGGVGKAVGLFNNLVFGTEETTVQDYAGKGVSVSGSAKKLSVAATIPYDDNTGGSKAFYEIGFVPWGIGGMEVGITETFGQVALIGHTGILAETGRWWGNFWYDLFHPGENIDSGIDSNECE